MAKYLFLAVVLLCSCGPAGKLKRAERLIKKAEEQGAFWYSDTVLVKVPVILTETHLDSIFISKPGDTVVLKEDRLQVKYVRLPGDSVFIEGKCESDTVYKEVPVTVTQVIKVPEKGLRWFHLIGIGFALGIVAVILLRR